MHVPATHLHKRGLRLGQEGMAPPSLLAAMAMLPRIMKARPPNIFFSVSSGSLPMSCRIRSASSSSKAMATIVLSATGWQRIRGAPIQVSNVLSHVRRPPHLRLCCPPFALVGLVLLPLSPLLSILRLLSLPLVSRILILLSWSSHQCPSERARAVKIIRR